MTTLVSYHESTVVVNEAVLGEVPPILRKADPRNYKDHRMVDAKGNTVLTEKYLKQLCREQGGYQTAELNDKLFLHFKALNKIAGLEAYTGLTSVWLEGNGIALIENLDTMPLLRYLHENCIRTIENLSHLTQLDTLNLSNNLVHTVVGLSDLSNLSTLQLAKNYLQSVNDIQELALNQSLTCIDLSHNKIDDVAVLDVLSQLPNLAVVNLMGNPVTQKIPSYRKTVISRLHALTFLDDRPVSDEERLQIEAWAKGGLDAEREERRRQSEFKHSEHLRMKKIAEAAKAKRRVNYPDDPEEPRYNDPAIQHMYAEMVGKIEGSTSNSTEVEFVDQLDVPELEVATTATIEEIVDHTTRPPVREFKAMRCDGTK